MMQRLKEKERSATYIVATKFMAAKKQTWFFDHTTLPKKLIHDGEEMEVTGIFLSYSPRAMFCGGCGTMYNCRELNSVTFDGYICPTCGMVHSNKTVINERLHVGGCFDGKAIIYKGGNIHETSTTYKLQETGKKLFRIETGETKTQIVPLSKWRNYSRSLKQKFLDTYRNELPDMFVVLAELELANKLGYSNSSGFYDHLDVVQDYYDKNPALIVELLNANDGVFMKYDQFEALYPEYLLPLTGRLIKDFNPAYYARYHWSNPPKFPSIDSFANYEALMCVISYYKSGLISFNQMIELLNCPKGLNNPAFIKTFKKNYMQMSNYLSDLGDDMVNVSRCQFDVKEYYRQKTIKYFLDYGYTMDQVAAAMDGAKDELDFLNRIGSTRRKLK